MKKSEVLKAIEKERKSVEEGAGRLNSETSYFIGHMDALTWMEDMVRKITEVDE